MKFLAHISLTIIALCIAVFSSRAAGAALPPSALADSLPPYVQVLEDGEDCVPVLPDSIFNSIAARTIFRVNRTELNLADPLLQELVEKTLPLINRRDLMLCGFDLRGAASPEGPYDNNVRLSVGRAAALRQFLSEHIDSVADFELSTTTVAEDYDYLLYILRKRGDSAARLVADAIELCGPDGHACIKDRLMRFAGGRVWERLLRDYYPELRAARIVLYFRRIHPDVHPTVAATAPTELQVHTGYAAPLYEPIARRVVYERPHRLSISSNLLYDAFWMPHFGWAPMVNLGLEYFPKDASRWTFRAAFMWPYYHKWSSQRFFQIRDYHLEVRRYFNPGMLHTGAYAAAYANATKYGVGLGKRKGWKGEGIGAALKLGYVVPLGSGRWRLDFHVAAGAWVSRYDPYVYGNPITGEEDGDYYYDWTGNPDDFRRRNHRFFWAGPTEVGITLSFDLLYKRIFKHGMSMCRKEVVTE